jgi:hypothetical protein
MAGHGVSVGSAISGEIVVLTGVFGFQGTQAPDGVKLLPVRCGERIIYPLICFLTTQAKVKPLTAIFSK